MGTIRFAKAMIFAVSLAFSQACGGGSGGECSPGEADCACRASNECDAPLVCDLEANLCVGLRSTELPAIDPAARSCELLIEDAEASVAGARFDASVRGETIRQAPRTAVTFFGTSDAPISRAAVRIELIGTGGMRIARGRCFDRDGHPLPGGGIETDG